MEYLGALLEGQASRPAEHRRCALVSGEGFKVLDAAFPSDDSQPTNDKIAYMEF